MYLTLQANPFTSTSKTFFINSFRMFSLSGLPSSEPGDHPAADALAGVSTIQQKLIQNLLMRHPEEMFREMRAE